MIYVDVRKFSLADLSEAVNFPWVKDYNDRHKPRQPRQRKPQPEYPRSFITSILGSIDDSGILDLVNHDEEQVKLIGKELLNGMLAKGIQEATSEQ